MSDDAGTSVDETSTMSAMRFRQRRRIAEGVPSPIVLHHTQDERCLTACPGGTFSNASMMAPATKWANASCRHHVRGKESVRRSSNLHRRLRQSASPETRLVWRAWPHTTDGASRPTAVTMPIDTMSEPAFIRRPSHPSGGASQLARISRLPFALARIIDGGWWTNPALAKSAPDNAAVGAKCATPAKSDGSLDQKASCRGKRSPLNTLFSPLEQRHR